MSCLRALYLFIYEALFGCSHRRLTRPFTLEAHSYKVCLECGRHLPYSLEKMRTFYPWEIVKAQAEVTAISPLSIASGYTEDDEFRPNTAVA